MNQNLRSSAFMTPAPQLQQLSVADTLEHLKQRLSSTGNPYELLISTLTQSAHPALKLDAVDIPTTLRNLIAKNARISIACQETLYDASLFPDLGEPPDAIDVPMTPRRLIDENDKTSINRRETFGEISLLPNPGEASESSALKINMPQSDFIRAVNAFIKLNSDISTTDRVDALFLAVGSLRWNVDGDASFHETPILLLPIEIHENGGHVEISVRSELRVNQALLDLLVEDFQLTAPSLDDHETYFRELSATIESKPEWTIDHAALHIGIYSPLRLQIVHDLDLEFLRKGAFTHPASAALLGGPALPTLNPYIEADADLDVLFTPADLIQIADADESQTIALQTIRAHRNTAIQYSQIADLAATIANICAGALNDDKNVLIVAADPDLRNRIQEHFHHCELQDLSHAPGVAPSALPISFATSKPFGRDRFHREVDPSDEIQQTRDILNNTAAQLHSPGDMGVTIHEAVSWLVWARDKGIETSPEHIAEARAWTARQCAQIIDATEILAALTAKFGALHQHPWFGAFAPSMDAPKIQKLTEALTELAEFSPRVSIAIFDLTKKLNLIEPPAIATAVDVLEVMAKIGRLPQIEKDLALKIAKSEPAQIARIAQMALRITASPDFSDFNENAWEANAEDIRNDLKKGLASSLGRFSPQYQMASKTLSRLLTVKLPFKPKLRIELTESLIHINQLIATLTPHKEWIEAELGDFWMETPNLASMIKIGDILSSLAVRHAAIDVHALVLLADSDIIEDHAKKLGAAITKIGLLTAEIVKLIDLNIGVTFRAKDIRTVPISKIADKAEKWLKSITRYDEWLSLNEAYEDLCSLGAVAFANPIAYGSLASASATDHIMTARANAAAQQIFSANPQLKEFNGLKHNALIEKFQFLEKHRRVFVAHALKKKVYETKQPIHILHPVDVSRHFPIQQDAIDLVIVVEDDTPTELLYGAVARGHQIVVMSEKISVETSDRTLFRLCKSKGFDTLELARRPAQTSRQALNNHATSEEDPFQTLIVETLNRSGYPADPADMTSQTPIIAAVKNPKRPETYWLAIQSDGKEASKPSWARERYMHREARLLEAGWTIRRVWVLDWYHRCDQLLYELPLMRIP